MASEKIREQKELVVAEIAGKIQACESVILFSYQGLTVADLSKLRVRLHESGSEIKVYKNTLLSRALDQLKISLEGFTEGPNAIVFGKELLDPIKIISDYAKENDKLEIRVGIINGDVASIDVIREYASIPSRDGLLTMLASGMIQFVKELSIGLNLYAEQLSDGDKPEEKEEVKPEATAEVVEEKQAEETVEVTEEVTTETNTEEENN